MTVNINYFDRAEDGSHPSVTHLPVVEVQCSIDAAWGILDAASGTRFASAAGIAALAIMLGAGARVWAGSASSDEIAFRAQQGAFFIEDGGRTIYRKTPTARLLSAAEVRAEAESARSSEAWANARSFLALATKALEDSRVIYEQELRRAG